MANTTEASTACSAWLCAKFPNYKHSQETQRMKSLKKWMLVLAVSGPMVTTVSCSGTFIRQLRDAVFEGATGFVQTATADLLASLTAGLMGG